MRRRLACLVLLSVTSVFTALSNAGKVWATSAVGFTSTTLVHGELSKLDGFHKSTIPNASEDEDVANVWLSLQKPGGPSDLYVQKNVWQPGGSTGWHTHPGQSLIIVTLGTVTDYEGKDSACKSHVYKQGESFADSGDDHVHIIRNESDSPAQTIAIQVIPAGTARRIDVAEPGNCRF